MSTSLEPEAWLRGHRAAVSCLDFVSLEAAAVRAVPVWLVSGDCAGNLIVWDLRTRRIAKLLQEEHEGGVLQVVCRDLLGKDDGLSSSSSWCWMSQGRVDGNLKIWRTTDTGGGGAALEIELVNVVRLGTESFCKAAVRQSLPPSSSARLLQLACTKSGEASIPVIWTQQPGTASLRQSHEFVCEAKTGMVMCVEFAAEDKLLAAYEDGYLRVFSISDDRGAAMLASICVQPEFLPATTFVYCRQTNTGLAAGASNIMTQFSLSSGVVVRQVPVLAQDTGSSSEDKLGKGVGQIALRPDARLCAVASWDHRVRVFHWKTLKPLAVLKSHRDSVQCLAFSADSSLLATGSKDRNIAVWRLYPP